MVYKIEWKKEALKELEKLDNSIKIQISKFIDKLQKAESPKMLGKPLKDNLAGYWGYRVGNYRIIAEILDDKLVILIVDIGHRKEVYK